MDTLNEWAFFAGRSKEYLLYTSLKAQMSSVLPFFELCVQKTQISFINPKIFACVSLRWKESIVLSIGLPDRIVSPRIHQAVQINSRRWTNHIRLYSVDEMDDELMEWIKAAYAFACPNTIKARS